MKAIRKLFLPLTGAMLLVALVVMNSFGSFKQMKSVNAERNNTYALLTNASDWLSKLKDADNGQRGYLFTGDTEYLQPYVAVRDTVRSHLDELISSAKGSAASLHLAAMVPLVDAKMAEMANLIEWRRHNDMQVSITTSASRYDNTSMDSIRGEMANFLRLERDELARQDEMLQASMRQLSFSIGFASILSLMFLCFFVYWAYRARQQLKKNVVHSANDHLLDKQGALNKQLQLANNLLRLSEAKALVTLNSIGDAVIVTDAEGRVTLLNPVAESLTGWKLEDAMGKPVETIFRILNQETRQPSKVPVMATLANGTVQGLANHTILVARDGNESSIADSCAPIRDPDGDVVGAVLVFRDVTEEYALQQSQRDSSALIHAILNTAADGIVTLNASGGIVERVNAAAERIFGYSAAELVGQNFHLLIPELDQHQRNGSLEYYAAGEVARASGLGREVIGRRKDGSAFPLEIAVSETWLGGRRYFTSILRDVTLRKSIETERNEALAVADKANRAKTDFLSSMSHELRTPLNAILGFAQLIESGTPAPSPQQQKSLVQILMAGWYLLELINQILDLAQIESGSATLSREAVSLAEVIEECRLMIETQASKREITMIVPYIEPTLYANVDRTRIKQVLINLLFNAIKYNNPGGNVFVKAWAVSANSIRISVRDTGSGLTSVQLSQLFQPFNRLGRELGVEEGTGIGLVVTKRLVELMGGAIGVESTVGEGTEFWVEFTLATAPRLTSHEHQQLMQRPPMAVGTPRRTVLYVEDNPANLQLVEQLIARRPELEFLSAADGHLGIEYAIEYLPEVILMDINLPGISGLEAMRVLRANPTTAFIPIIALSANAVPRDIEKGLEAGFYNYITKPIKVDRFMDALDAALKFSQSERIRRNA